METDTHQEARHHEKVKAEVGVMLPHAKDAEDAEDRGRPPQRRARACHSSL